MLILKKTLINVEIWQPVAPLVDPIVEMSSNLNASPIRMRQKYTRVNIFWCANFTWGKQMAHANANTHQSIFT